MTKAHYSGNCTTCGSLHTRTLGNEWSPNEDEDFFSTDCTNPTCDPRHSAFMTRVVEGDDAE